MGIYEETEIRFLVAGHTKNVCDSAFGHIKRHFRRTDVLIPSQMNILINSSSSRSVCIPAPSVDWADWKRILQEFFRLPNELRILKHHIFQFTSLHPGILTTREFSDSTHFETHNLLKRYITPEPAKINTRWGTKSSNFKSRWPLLETVKSAKEGNRKRYLEKYICEKYYPSDESFRSNYFASGKLDQS